MAAKRAVPLATGTGDVQAVPATRGLRYQGHSIRESGGVAAVATVILRHGTAATDPIVAVIELAADKHETVHVAGEGVTCPNGIFVDRVAGETEGAIYITA